MGSEASTAAAAGRDILRQLHVLLWLEAFAPGDVGARLAHLRRELDATDADLRTLARRASDRLRESDPAAADYLDAEFRRLSGEPAAFRSQCRRLRDEARGTLAGACAVVALALHVSERLRTFRNETTPPEGLADCLGLALEHPVPEPRYENETQRVAYAADLGGDPRWPVDALVEAAHSALETWYRAEAQHPDHPGLPHRQPPL